MTHYIYIPGFGGHFDILRRAALRRWEKDGAKATLVPMHWSDKTETYEQKCERVEQVMDESGDDEVVLVGESAGGAMALYVYALHHARIKHVVTVCGYNHGAEDVIQFQRRRHPAFYPLLVELDKKLPTLSPDMRQRITTMYSRRDRVVEVKHSYIKGAHAIELPTPGHFLSIGYVLTKRIQPILSSTRYTKNTNNQ